MNGKESFIGLIHSKIAILEGTSTSHLLASRQEHTRHMGICSVLKDLGGPGFFHNSFQSLNTLTSGNSSLYLTYRPPPAVNTHFHFFLSPVRMENSWPTSLCTNPHQWQKGTRDSPAFLHLQQPSLWTKLRFLFSLFLFVSSLFLLTPFDYEVIHAQWIKFGSCKNM